MAKPIIDFRFLELSGLSLPQEHLPGISLRGTRLEKADFHESFMENADLSSTLLDRSNFERANLTNAKFEYALMYKANFSHANLRHASLIKAKASKSDFSEARLEGAILRDTDLSRTNLKNANLTGAYLLGANLSGANLKGATLVGANLRECNFMYAKTVGVDFTSADLTNAIISEKQLNNAKAAFGAKIDGIRDRLAPPRRLTKERIETERLRLQQFLQTNVEEARDLGLLDLIELGLTDISTANESLDKINRATVNLGEAVRRKAAELTTANQENASNKVKLSILRELGGELEKYASILRIESPVMAERMTSGIESYGKAANMLWAFEGEKSELYARIQSSLQRIVDGMKLALSAISTMQMSMANLPNLSSQLNNGKENAVDAIRELVVLLDDLTRVAISTQSRVAYLYTPD